MWDSWSATGAKYGGSGVLQKHWHSFGKTSTPVGYGTLLHYAKEGGYCEPITFVYDGSLGSIDDVNDSVVADNVNVDSVKSQDKVIKHLLDEPVDVRRPPDFVGELTQWINDQCLYPRENLAVAAALCAVSLSLIHI